MSKIFLPISICLILLFNSCNSTKTKEIEFTNFSTIEVNQFKKKNVKISSNLEFKNPNKFSILLLSIDADVFINGKDVGSYINKEVKEINSEKSISIPIEFNFLAQEAFDSLKTGLIKIKSEHLAKVKIEGIVTTKALDKEIQTAISTEQEVLFKN